MQSRLRLLIILVVTIVGALGGTAGAYPLTLESSTNLSLTREPAAGAMAPDGRFVYLVVAAATPVVVKVDVSGATPTVVGSLSVTNGGNGWPNAAVVSPDGAYVYVGLLRTIAKIRTSDMTPVAAWDKQAAGNTDDIEHGVISRDGQYGYFADDGSPRRLMRIRLSDMTLDRMAQVPAAGGLALSPDGATLYAADNGSSTVEVTEHDPATLAQRGTAAVTDIVGSRASVISPDGRYLYLTNFGFNQSTQVAKVDLRTMAQIGTRTVLAGAKGGWAIALSLDGTRLFTGNLNAPAQVNEIRTTDMAVVDTQTLTAQEGVNLQVALVSPNGTQAFFAAQESPYPLLSYRYAVAHRLTVAKAGTGTGTVTSDLGGVACGAVCASDVSETSTVTLTATADAGSTFDGWSGACTGTGTCVVAMTEARTVTATFSAPAAAQAASTTTRPGPAVLPLRARTAGLAATPSGRLVLPIRCRQTVACFVDGVLTALVPRDLVARANVRKVLARFDDVRVRAGATRNVAVRLDARTYRALQERGIARVRATLETRNRAADGTSVVRRAQLWIRIAPLTPAPAPVTG